MIFILPLLAVLIGYLIAKFLKPSSSSTFKLLLSFSGAYLLSVTVFELLPEVYEHSGKEIGVFILLGLLFQIILEFISKGLEHGHMHHNPNTQQFPLMLLVSLGIHSLLEGFPLNESSHLLYGVAIHKIPVAAILSIFLFNSKIGNIKAFLFLLLFALMTPLGSWLKLQFEFIQTYAAYLNAIVIGVFLHISTTISKNHKFNASKLGVIILGIILAYFM